MILFCVLKEVCIGGSLLVAERNCRGDHRIRALHDRGTKWSPSRREKEGAGMFSSLKNIHTTS